MAAQRAAVLARHDRDELYSAAVAAALRSRVCVLGGYLPTSAAIPPDPYRRLAADLRANGTVVVAALSGELREPAMTDGADALKTRDEAPHGERHIPTVDDQA